MKEEMKIKFGFGLNETHCEACAFDTIEELLKFAQSSWYEMDGNPFDEDCEYSGLIWIGVAETFTVSDFAPTLDDIADSITDKFYTEHNVDECEDAQIIKREEAEKEWKSFVEKYFDTPGGFTIACNWFGIYDLKEHKWYEKYPSFEKYIKE